MACENADAARQAVLQAPELLEAIISHLPLLPVFTAMRVCRCWNTLINNSPLLQKKLFLPTPTAKVIAPRVMLDIFHFETQDFSVPIYDEHIIINPFFGRQRQQQINLVLENIPWVHIPVKRIDSAPEGWPANHYVFSQALQTRSTEDELSKGQRWTYPTPSWQRMFITDPPCSVVHGALAEWFSLGDVPHYIINFSVRHHGGITFGLLGEIVARAREAIMQYGNRADVDIKERKGLGLFDLFSTWEEVETAVPEERGSGACPNQDPEPEPEDEAGHG